MSTNTPIKKKDSRVKPIYGGDFTVLEIDGIPDGTVAVDWAGLVPKLLVFADGGEVVTHVIPLEERR